MTEDIKKAQSPRMRCPTHPDTLLCKTYAQVCRGGTSKWIPVDVYYCPKCEELFSKKRVGFLEG